jgi:sugar/nucleoside kinase (ribokinase family)
MPRLLAVGHVTWDRVKDGDVLGGTVSYAAATARRLGWEVGVLTSAGADFEPERDLPGVPVFLSRSAATTRFKNVYGPDGARQQYLISRADPVDLTPLPDEWRSPDVLFLGPVAGEVEPRTARAFQAGVVGAGAQGWLREFEEDGLVRPREWKDPRNDLDGVHALCLSEHDLPDANRRASEFLSWVPIVTVTRGWRGLWLHTREGVREVPSLPREEVDPTGAGDVFASSFLMRYQETGDPVEAAGFGACAASCAVEGLGTSSLGDRDEIQRRMSQRDRSIEEGEWEE